MRKILGFLLVPCMLCSFAACSEVPAYAPDDFEGDIGGDWHVWGLYDFAALGDLDIVINQVNDETSQHIGYDIYRDGDALGELLCEIRCWDGGYAPEDMDQYAGLNFEDHNGDGQEDIAAPLVNGDEMWYLQEWDASGNVCFTYAGVQEATR